MHRHSAFTSSGIMMRLITSKCGNMKIISLGSGISEKVWDLREGPGYCVRARVTFWILNMVVRVLEKRMDLFVRELTQCLGSSVTLSPRPQTDRQEPG